LQLKKLLDEGVIGQILNINHTEPVGWYHFTHSFVRGNWGREDKSTFSLMSKCCHDIDILMWMLGPENFKSVSSFGHLSLFTKENKPAEAEGATRCLDCPIKDSCPYSATSLYLKRKWKTDAVGDIEDEAHVIESLKSGPYGRCAWECDNDVCDNQVVSLDFGNATATMTMIATSEELCQRKVCIYGSKGEITTDYRKIRVFDFSTETAKEYSPGDSSTAGHGGGDTGLAFAFAYALRDIMNNSKTVAEATACHIGCTPEDILASHKVVFLAEKARRENKVVTMSDKL
jgi:predicted dehydrogenase